ncbi:hypothetical protein LAZ67_9002754 [Cordylochernes scorpioides]|uniref:Mos1 transposase HTH domain-containing protein n=1 Tax=Cordylochernes scorpioides TaxID=51811 RepID=A0ABY6KVQ2_9ARAC|nr:hypothetical protein LAZ67_9002754 [Cordylochernes scorpioides]
MEKKLKQRICIELRVKLQISATETFEMLNKAFPNDAPKRTTVFEWHSRFKAGRISIEDDPRQGRPIFQRTDENVQKITDLIKENPRTTFLELEQDTGISKTTIGRIVIEDLKLKKTPAKFISRFLTNEQKLCRLATCEDMLEMTRTDPEWKDKIITGDETWVYGYDPETKPQSAEWRGQTVIKEMYLGILRRLREAIRKKRPEKWTNGDWILYHDNACPHTAHLVASFLAKNWTQILPQPPYSPDIAPSDFFLFPKIKAVLKGIHFDTRYYIIEKSLLALKSIPKEAYKTVSTIGRNDGAGFHRRVKAKTSLQDDDVPIDDTTTKPLFTPQEKGRKGTMDKVPRLRWNPWQKHHSKKWVAAFKLGRISTENEHRLGRPVESVTQENIDKIHYLVMLDRRMTVRQIEETLGILKTTVDRIMREHLGLRKLSARWVPKLLTPDQKAVKRKLSLDNIALFEANPEELVNRFVTMDETWANHFTPEPNNNPCNGDTQVPLPPRKPRQFHQQGRKIVYHQDNVPSHRSLQAMAAIYDSGFELLPHAPYSPDLAPSDFHLFPHFKKSLSGIHFRSDEKVIDAVTSFFESLETSFFLEGIKALEKRWKKRFMKSKNFVRRNSEMEQRAVIKFNAKLGRSESKTYILMKQVYGTLCLSKSNVFIWHKRFSDGRNTLEDDKHTGRPSSSKTPESIEKVREFVANNRSASLRMMAEVLHINKETIRTILHEDLGGGGVKLKDIISAYENDSNFLKSIVTGDETWCFQYDPKTKRQSAEWKSKNSPQAKRKREKFVALTRKQRHLATEIGLGLPHPVREWIRPAAGRQSKYPPTNQGRVGDTAVPSRQEKKPRGSLPKMTSGNFVFQSAERYWKTLHALTVPLGYYRFEPPVTTAYSESRQDLITDKSTATLYHI